MEAFKDKIIYDWRLSFIKYGEFYSDNEEDAGSFAVNLSADYAFSYLPTPIWCLPEGDAVVLLFERPPPCEYWSFTLNVFSTWKRGAVFASLGDALNAHSPEFEDEDYDGVYAHVVATQSSGGTVDLIKDKLVEIGISEDAIHVAVIPNTVAKDDALQKYEVMFRAFRFADQEEGEAYMQSGQPVFQVSGSWFLGQNEMEAPSYRTRISTDSVNEPIEYGSDFGTFQSGLVGSLEVTFGSPSVEMIPFGGLTNINGLDFCLQEENIGSECIADCPDASYFGLDVTSDWYFDTVTMSGYDEFHLVTMVDHRATGSSTYSNIIQYVSLVETIDRRKVTLPLIPPTSTVVVTNHDFHDGDAFSTSPFFTWIFTRNPAHCDLTVGQVKGCTVISLDKVGLHDYITYGERAYLNPATGTGPDYDSIIPGVMYRFTDVDDGCTDDDPTWTFKGLFGLEHDCGWIAHWPQTRCHYVGEDGTQALLSCCAACAAQ